MLNCNCWFLSATFHFSVCFAVTQLNGMFSVKQKTRLLVILNIYLLDVSSKKYRNTVLSENVVFCATKQNSPKVQKHKPD